MIVGVIGAGAVAAASHLPVLANLPDVRIGWIADQDRRRADLLARCYRAESYGTDVLATTVFDCDVLLFAVPYGVRAAYYERFADHRAAWYVEKPLALTAAEHLALCARKPDHLIAGGFQRRASGAVQLARSVVQEQLFGTLRRVDVGLGYRGRTVGSDSERGDRLIAGGGIIADVGIHCIDTILYCIEPAAFDVRRCEMILDEGLDIHTDADILLRTGQGADVEMRLTMSNLVDTSEEIAFEFDQATVRFSIFKESPVQVRARAAGAVFTLGDVSGGYPRTSDQVFHRFWRAFLDGVRSGRANFTSARRMLPTTQAVEALYAAGTATIA